MKTALKWFKYEEQKPEEDDCDGLMIVSNGDWIDTGIWRGDEFEDFEDIQFWAYLPHPNDEKVDVTQCTWTRSFYGQSGYHDTKTDCGISLCDHQIQKWFNHCPKCGKPILKKDLPTK